MNTPTQPSATPATQFKTSEAKLESARAYKLANKERIQELNRARNLARKNDPVAWAIKLASDRKCAKKNRDKRREYDRSRDPVKKAARAEVRCAIARGKLKRGSCEVCGKPNAEAHHEDYSKPMVVRWLCRIHHKQIHE